MFFVHTFTPAPHKPWEFNETNVRIGGFKTAVGAINQARKHAPCIIRDEKRAIIGQTIDKELPYYVNEGVGA